MGNLLNKLKQADDASLFGQIDDREQAVVDRYRQKAPGGFRRRLADADAKAEIDTRRQQRAYAEQAPPEVVQPAKEMLTNLGDRQKVLETFRKLTPEQRQEALKLAPGIAQQLGDDRGGVVGRSLGAVSRGISHGVSQPIAELLGAGGTPEEIEYIRQLDAAASQEFSPARPGDPWYQSGPLQAAEMAPWMATVVGGAGVGRAIATGAAKPVAAQMATRAGLGRATLNAAGKAGELAGITAASFPPQYAQEVDQLKEIGMQDGPQLRLLAAGTAVVSGLMEGAVPNPFKTGPVPLTEGAVKAARSYLWEAAKRAPGEMSEEYLQGVTSGLGKTVGSWLDENAEDKSVADAFKNGWEQAKEAALPMAFLLGVPAVGGAGLSAARAQRLQQAMAKGFVSSEDAKELGIAGKNRPERMANAQAELEQLSAPLETPPQDPASPPGALPPGPPQFPPSAPSGSSAVPPALPPTGQPPRLPGPAGTIPPTGQPPRIPGPTQPPLPTQGNPPLPVPSTPPSGTATPPAATPPGAAQPGQTLVGTNSQGQQVFEDINGVRSVLDGNVRITEPVEIRPFRTPEGKIGYRPALSGERSPEFEVAPPAGTEQEPNGNRTGTQQELPKPATPQPTEATQKPASGSSAAESGTSGWDVVFDSGKLYRENPSPDLKPSERIKTRQPVDPSEGVVLATKDQFGKSVPPETMKARQEFVDKAKPGVQFRIPNFNKNALLEVEADGTITSTESTTKRVMGNVRDMANRIMPDKPGEKGYVVSWESSSTAATSQGMRSQPVSELDQAEDELAGLFGEEETLSPKPPAVDAETKGTAKEATVDRDPESQLDAMPRVKRPGIKEEPTHIKSLIPKSESEPDMELALQEDRGEESEEDYINGMVTTETVPIERLESGQSIVEAEGVRHFIKNPKQEGLKPPLIIQFGDKMIVRDGNTRINAAILRKEKSIRARVLFVSEPVSKPSSAAKTEEPAVNPEDAERESNRAKARELWNKHGKQFMEDTYKREGLKDTASDKKRKDELRDNVEGNIFANPKGLIRVLSEYEPKPEIEQPSTSPKEEATTPTIEQLNEQEALIKQQLMGVPKDSYRRERLQEQLNDVRDKKIAILEGKVQKPESKWSSEAKAKLEAVPALKGAKIETDEKTGTVKVTRPDGLETTIQFNADEELAEAAKKRGRKPESVHGWYIRKPGEKQGRILVHSKANHTNILNHEVMHWLEDNGVVTKEEVEQYGGREAIAEKYGKWVELKQRKKDSVFQRIYDALEPVFSSQARFFEEVGARKAEPKVSPIGDKKLPSEMTDEEKGAEVDKLFKPKPEPPKTIDQLRKLTFDDVRDSEQTEGVGKNKGVTYRRKTYEVTSEDGKQHRYKVTINDRDNKLAIEDLGITKEQQAADEIANYDSLKPETKQKIIDIGMDDMLSYYQKYDVGLFIEGRTDGARGTEKAVSITLGGATRAKVIAEAMGRPGDTTITWEDVYKFLRKPQENLSQDKKPSVPEEPATGFAGLPRVSRAIFETAMQSSTPDSLLEILHSGNKNMRAEFELRTGIKLPATVKGTKQVVEQWFKDGKKPAQTTQPSADQVNVDSGAESKVKPETTAEVDDFTAAVNAAFDERFGDVSEEKAPKPPKKQQGRKKSPTGEAKPEKKTLSEKAADRKERTSAAKAEKLAKFKDLLKKKNIINAVYDPKEEAKADLELLAATVELTAAAIDDGVSTFAEYVAWIVDSIGESATRTIAPYLEAGWARLGTYNRFRDKIDKAGKVADILTEIDNVDTTRDDNSEAMGEDTPEPDSKPEKGGSTGDVLGEDQPADTSTRGDDEATGSGPTEDSGGNRDGVSSPAGSLNNHQIAENPTWLEGGPVKKLNRNIDAITTMNRIEAEKRRATPSEQSIIAGYTGWGHLKQFFIRDSDLRAIKAIQGDKWNLNAFKTLDARTEEQIRDRGRRKGDSEEKIEAKIQREKANNKHRIRLATSMTPAEYAQARKSTRYSHYTDPAIARSMWGFIKNVLPEAGKIRVLEPSEGSGMFWGTMPDAMFKRSEMHGVDMDPSSSRIAKHLYPSVRHLNVPFQQSPYPEGFFDLAVTNVPFNKNPVQDPNEEFDNELSLHNYFFAKTASRLREGGVVVFITTHFTMDAGNAKQRSIITNQGLKFLGAVRLNQDAFGNVANTKVTTDIIVMQKVAPGSLTSNNKFEMGATDIDAMQGNESVKITVHPYFQSRPGMVAGKITANGEMRGAGPELTVESDMTPEETAAFIEKALSKIEIDKQAFIDGQQHRKDMAEAEQGGTTFVPDHLKGLGLGKLAVDGSNLVVRTSEETMLIVKTEFSPTLKARAESWFAIRDALANLQQLQTRSDNPESEIEAARKELNRAYDEFVGEFNEKKNDYSNYKPLNTTYNKSMFAADFMSASVQALENTKLIPTGELDKDGKEKTRLRVEKASIFTERTEWPPEQRPKPKTVKEALAHSMFTNGGVDIDWIATTLGKDKAEVAKQMEEYAFEVPNDGGWEIKEVYLSGNIAKKLETAEEAAKKNPAFTRNVDALRDVLPVPKTFEQLKVYPNSPFLPVEILRGFVADTLGLGSFELYRNEQDLGGGWRANYAKNDQSNSTTQDLVQYAVREGSRIRKRGFELFLDMIAGKPTIILDRDADDRTYVNEAATNLAKTKRLDLSRAFDTFIRSSQERMDAVTNEFNKLLSGYVKPSIPDWVVSFDGMSSNWKDLMRSYQKEAAAKIAMGGNTLLAHRVGYGKTLSGVAGIMEQRRLGVARKPLAVVPNHLTGQWAKAFADFYPSAKVMAPTSKDFEKGNRQATMNRIMTGNWDAIIIPESSFKKLPMSSEYVEQFFQEQISQAIDAAERARAEEGADPRTIAELEDVTERLRNQLAKYLAEAQKDPGPFFDEMGIDSLTVDEAHHYKNLPFYTQNTRVAGINPTGSQQAFDMLMKTDFINALTGSRNVTFLTGTPIANSMTEAWVMMRYLMPETLKESNVFAFDDWKNAFGEVVDRTRVNTIGTGFRTETRFQQFVNLDVLAKMFQQVADIQMINNDVQVPPLKGGKPQSIVVPASDAMKNFMLGLASRSANMPKDPSEDNMLNVMTVGAGAAIDFRLLDAAAMPSETSKITVAADEVARIFNLTTPFKGTQIIWADRGVPKAAKKLTAEMKQLGAWMLEEVQDRPLTMEDIKAKWKELRPTKNAGAELQRFMGMALQDMNYTTGSEDDEVSYKVDMKGEPTVYVNEITDVDPNITEQSAPPWNVYQQMKEELIARGIPAEKIAFIHDYKTAAQKVQLWEKMNNGDMRVLIGNTPRLGTGANIQVRLVAAHHLDAPWRPADVEQRDGRIIRSGNRVMTIGDKIGFAEETGVDLDGVIINRYVTEGSIDARYWDTNEMKASMLQDFWSGNPGVSIEELGATTLSMSDVKAAAVANPLLKKKIELEHEVNKLSDEYRGAVQSKTQSDSRLKEAQKEVPEAKKKLEAAKKRVAWWNEGKSTLPEGENFGVEIDGEVLFRRDDIAKAIDRKLHEIGREVPLGIVAKDASDWAKQSFAKSSEERELGKIFGKKITFSVEGGFRNPETGEVVGGNTWQEKALAKELKDGSWERSYNNPMIRVAGIEGLARLGTTSQGFAARIRNFVDPGETWVESHEKALASKEKALSEIEKLNKSIPEPDSTKLVAKQQELEQVSNEIGDEDDDQITYWVGTEELVKTLGEGAFHDQLGRVDSAENILGYIIHPKDGKLSVFNRAGDTRPPAHAMVWVEGENATIGYVPRDKEGVMGLPILKPRKQIGKIDHPDHGVLFVFNHKEGDVTQQGKVWVENEDGTQDFGYQDKALNVVMGIEMQKYEISEAFPKDVKLKTDQWKSEREGTGLIKKDDKAASEPVAETPKPVQAEFMEGANAPGIKQTLRVVAGERTLLMERNGSDGEWSIKEGEKYTGEVKGSTPVKTGGEVIVSGIVETKKAKEIAQRIIDGTFDKDFDKRFVREDDQNIGMTNAGIAKEIKDQLQRRDSFARLLREHGLVTDGRLLMKVSDKDRDTILKAIGDTFEGTDLSSIKKTLTDGQKALSRSANAMKPIGYRGGYLDSRTVVLQSQDGDAMLLDKELHDTILKKYPDAVPYFLDDGQPVSYVNDGDVVAVVMPMSMKNPDAKLKSLVSGKYDFEAEAAEAAKFPSQSKTKLKQAAEKANQELADAEKELGKIIGGKRGLAGSLPIFHPTVIAAAAKVVAKAIKAGTLNFAELMERMITKYGEAKAEQMRLVLQQEWDKQVNSNPIADEDGIPPKTPQPHPELVQPEPIPLTSVKNAIVDELRVRRGEAPMPDVKPQTVQQWLEVAGNRIADDPYAGNTLVEQLLTGNKTSVDELDGMVLQYHYRAVNNLFTAADAKLTEAKANGNPEDIAIAQDDARVLMRRLAAIETALDKAGTAWGRAGVSRQIFLKQDFSLASMVRRARVANAGNELSNKQVAIISEQANQIKDLQKKIAELEANAAEQQQVKVIDDAIKTDIEDFKKPVEKPKSKMRIKAEERVATAWKKIRDLKFYTSPVSSELIELISAYVDLGVVTFREFMYAAAKNMGAKQAKAAEPTFREAWDQLAADGKVAQPSLDINNPGQLTRFARNVQRTLIENGVTEREEIVDAVHEALQEIIPEITRRQAMDALSSYGQFSQLSKDPIDQIIRDINGQLQQLAKLEDMEQGIAPAKTGVERRSQSDEERRLTQMVNEAKRRGGFVVTDPETQLKSAMAAAKTAVRNRIADMNFEIQAGSRIVRGKTELIPDAELEQLRKDRDALQQVHKAMFPPKGATQAQKIASASRALDAAIASLEAKLAVGDISPAPQPTPLSTPELDAKRAKLKQLNAQRDALRKIANPGMTAEQIKIRALDKSIQELEKQLATGNFAPKPKSAPLTSPEINARQAKLEELRATKKAILAAANPKMTPEQRASRAYEAHLRKQLAIYLEKIAQGDFEPTPKKQPRVLTKAELDLKKQLADVKNDFFEALAKYHLENLSPGERAIDAIRESAHLSRAIMTSIDLSAVLRQGGLGVYSHPIMAKKAAAEMWKAIWSREAEFQSIEKLRMRPNAQFYEESGLNITDSEGKLTRQEEAFMGRWARTGIDFAGDAVQARTKQLLEPVAASARAYVTFINNLRADLFDVMVENLGPGGQVTKEEAKLIAKYINVATGRADLKALNDAAATLNTVFFAPRYVASRFQYLAMPFYLLGSKDSGRVKKLIAKEYARTFTGAAVFIGSLTALAYLAAGGDDEEEPSVELNPLSADFGKVRIDETRVDPLAGLAQVIVFSSRLAAFSTKSSVTGKVRPFYEGGPYETTHGTEVWRFLRTKLAPVPGAVVTAFSGMQNVVGEPVTPSGLVGGLFVPISTGEVISTMQHRGIPKGLALNVLNLLGASVNTYGPKTAYLDATPEKRAEMVKEYIKTMNWESDLPAFSQYLKPEELKQVQDRQDVRRGDLVFEAMGTVLPKEDYKTEVHYEEAKERHDKVSKDFEEFRKQYAPTVTDAIRYLTHHFDSEGGIKMQGTYKLKPSFKERKARLEKHYQSLPQ